MADFFISYNKADLTWAEWIAWQLEDAGYSVVIQAWDFHAGGNFVLDMQKAASESVRTIAVLSPDYLSSRFTAPEWAAAFAQDPTGTQGTLVPVRVRACEPTGLLPQIVYIDLVGIADVAIAKAILIDKVKLRRAKPTVEPGFPGSSSHRPSLTAKDEPRFPGVLPPIWNIQYRRNPHFTGRDDVMDSIDNDLSSRQVSVLTGLGGVGKGQIAVEFVYRHLADYSLIWWLRSEETSALAADYALLANELRLTEGDVTDQNVSVLAVRNWLGRNGGWLLIFDNASDPKDLLAYLPQGLGGHTIITSRNSNWHSLAEPVACQTWKHEESDAFLLKRTGRREEQSQHSRDLAGELGHLPLALEQAAAYISIHSSRFEDYLAAYRTRKLTLLERQGPETGDYQYNVATTWAINFEAVERESAAAAGVLRLSAYLAPELIDIEIFVRGASELPPALADVLASAAGDPVGVDELLEPLTRYSLIRRDIDAGTFDIHRLVKIVIQEGMDATTKKAHAERVIAIVTLAFPNSKSKEWIASTRLLPHSYVCQSLIVNLQIETDVAARLLNRMGSYLSDVRDYVRAEPLLLHALDIREEIFGAEDKITSITLNNLGVLYREMGAYDKSVTYLRRALKIRQDVFGPDDVTVAATANNLASSYTLQRNFDVALPLFERALGILVQNGGEEQNDVASTLNNISHIYSLLGRDVEAESYILRSLKITVKVRGEAHIDTAICLRSLGVHYFCVGKYCDSAAALRQALDIYEQRAGSDNLNTIQCREDHTRAADECNRLIDK